MRHSGLFCRERERKPRTCIPTYFCKPLHIDALDNLFQQQDTWDVGCDTWGMGPAIGHVGVILDLFIA